MQRESGVLDSLREQVVSEPRRIAEAKEKGQKVVGYFCPFVPEELILSGGMLPLRLTFDGGADDRFLNMVDAICISKPCESLDRIEERRPQVPVLSFEIPVTIDDFDTIPKAVCSFRNQIQSLRKQLEELAGRKISNSDIRRTISLCEGITKKLRALYEYPKSDPSPIEWRDLFELARSGFLIDRNVFLNELKELDIILRQKIAEGMPMDPRPRLMVAGASDAASNNNLLDVIEQAGGNIVIDCICTGSMFVRKRVPIFSLIENPLDSLVERYLYNVPAPCGYNFSRRLNYILKTARDLRVHGLIYYATNNGDWRDQFKVIKESLYKNLLVPTLLIERYPADTEELRSRAESFIDIVGGRV